MKYSIFNILALASSTLILGSCYSPKFMVDDDVYVLKPNDVPIGESLNDETSYSNFRENRRNGVNSQYSNDYYIVNNSFNNGWYGNNMMFGINSWYRPSFTIFYDPFMGFSYDPYGYYYGYGYPFGHYGYNNYYGPYSYYGGNYGYYSPFFNPYFGSGSSWGNGGNGWNYGNSGATVAYNHHNSPRGSVTGGFGNPNRLEGGPKVKSRADGTSGTTGTKSPVRLNNGDLVGRKPDTRSPGGTTLNPTRTPSGTSVTPSRGGSGMTVERNLQPVENRGVNTISNNGSYGRTSNETISSGSNSGGRTGISNSSGNSSRGGSTINESRSGGSFNSGSSSESSSGSRSSGGSSSGGSSSSGRRP